MKLTLEEQETIILFDNKNPEATVYTHQGQLIKDLKRKCKLHPEQFKIKCIDGASITFEIPKRYIKVGAPRNISDSDRVAIGERLKQARQ